MGHRFEGSRKAGPPASQRHFSIRGEGFARAVSGMRDGREPLSLKQSDFIPLPDRLRIREVLKPTTGDARQADILRSSPQTMEAATPDPRRYGRGHHTGDRRVHLQHPARAAPSGAISPQTEAQLPGGVGPDSSAAEKPGARSSPAENHAPALGHSPEHRRGTARGLLRSRRRDQLLLVQGARAPDRYALPAMAARRRGRRER